MVKEIKAKGFIIKEYNQENYPIAIYGIGRFWTIESAYDYLKRNGLL